MGSAPVSKTADDTNKSIVWLDSGVDSTDEFTNAQYLLGRPTNHLKTYKDEKECESYIRSLPREYRVVLIAEDKFGHSIIPRVHQLLQISAIFVRATDKKNEKWTRKYKKIKVVTEIIDEIVSQVLLAQEKQTSRDRFEESLLIDIHNTTGDQTRSITEQNEKFIQSQKLIYSLVRLRSSSTDRNDFITYCRKQNAYSKQQQDIITEFQQHYSPDSAIQWYVRDCFIYKLLNKALRTQNIDALYLFDFFIRDLHHQLKRREYTKLIHVYRGQLMPKDEVKKLKNSIGQLISINIFLSTTPDRQAAMNFSGNNEKSKGDLHPVLFEIEANPRLPGVKPFSDITSFTYLANEPEVLMMLGSIFRLVDLRYEDQLCIIQLVLCSDNDPTIKSILAQMKNDDHGKKSTTAGVFGNALVKMGKTNEADKYITRELHAPSNDPNAETEHAFDESIHFRRLGNAGFSKGNYSTSLNCFQRALDIRMKLLNPNDRGIAEIHHDMGNVYCAKGDYKRAIESYKKALTINKRAFGEDNLKVAESLSNIAVIYSIQHQYSDALNNEQKVLTIRQKFLPENHPMLGQSYTNIATIYCNLRNFDLALEDFNKALKIYEKCQPPQQLDMAGVYSGIGDVYLDKQNLREALSSFEKAAAIYRKTGPADRPNAIHLQEKINFVKSKLHKPK